MKFKATRNTKETQKERERGRGREKEGEREKEMEREGGGKRERVERYGEEWHTLGTSGESRKLARAHEDD
jgi:hypothetical protein